MDNWGDSDGVKKDFLEIWLGTFGWMIVSLQIFLSPSSPKDLVQCHFPQLPQVSIRASLLVQSPLHFISCTVAGVSVKRERGDETLLLKSDDHFLWKSEYNPISSLSPPGHPGLFLGRLQFHLGPLTLRSPRPHHVSPTLFPRVGSLLSSLRVSILCFISLECCLVSL